MAWKPSPTLSGSAAAERQTTESIQISMTVFRRNMQPFGMRVSIIEPGFFKTNVTRLDLIEADLGRLWNRLPQGVRDSYGPAYFDDCECEGRLLDC